MSGGKWTIDGRWVVVAPDDSIAFDPHNGSHPFLDLRDCREWIKTHVY